MKKILIKAYAQINLGDDLFIKMLCERYPDINFYIFATERYTKLDGLKLNNLYIKYNDNYYKKIIMKIGNYLNIPNLLEDNFSKNITGVVNIGGSIFIENNFSQEDYLIRSRNLKFGKNYFILGSNFGPYKSEKFKKDYEIFFENCKDVCFRDSKSYEMFKNISTVRQGQDIVFSLNTDNIIDNIENDYNLISVILPSKRKELKQMESEYFATMKKFIIESAKNNEKTKLMSFCKDEGDEIAISKILSMIPNEYHKKISVYYYRGNLNEALSIIKSAKRIVATRFHAMILGFVFNKPVFPICYSEKMINVLKDLEFKGNFVSFNKIAKFSYEKLLENKPLDESVLFKAKKGGEKHFNILDEFLNN